MHPRQTLTPLFSTFLKLVEDTPGDWITDPALSRSMTQCLSHRLASETSETFWAIYWHKHWQQNSKALAIGHLSAYLQESCYWSAKTLFRGGFNNPQLTVADLFQIAIAQVSRVLKGFNPCQGLNLKSYANIAFKSVIRDTLRQSYGIDICSDWALLRKTSEKRFIQVLEREGFGEETIDQYKLAWKCFKRVYVPTQSRGNRQLQRPDNLTWKAIAQLYNQERHSQLRAPGNTYTSEILERWLRDCAKWCRTYLRPQTFSPHPQCPIQEKEECGYQGQDPLVEMLLEEEKIQQQMQVQQLDAVLDKKIQELTPSLAELLHLYYCENWTQKRIADHQGVQQYTVCRQLGKARKILLVALTQWSQAQFNLMPNGQDIERLSSLLEEWLQGYYTKSS